MGGKCLAGFLATPSKCEFSFARKGLQCETDLQLAVSL